MLIFGMILSLAAVLGVFFHRDHSKNSAGFYLWIAIIGFAFTAWGLLK